MPRHFPRDDDPAPAGPAEVPGLAACTDAGALATGGWTTIGQKGLSWLRERAA
jgi:hypothetical protein